MTSQTKMDLKKIQDAIRMLGRPDRKTQLTTKVGENSRCLDAALTLIEDLCEVIREQEDLPREEAIDPFTGEVIRVTCVEC
jgi:hypothetical protein